MLRGPKSRNASSKQLKTEKVYNCVVQRELGGSISLHYYLVIIYDEYVILFIKELVREKSFVKYSESSDRPDSTSEPDAELIDARINRNI